MRFTHPYHRIGIAIAMSTGMAVTQGSAADVTTPETLGPVEVETLSIETARIQPVAEQHVIEQASVPPQLIPYVEPPVAESTPCSCCQSTCCTKKKKKAATANRNGAYKGLFYANDFRYLGDRCDDGPEFCGDALKGLACGRLDLGGEARIRFHSEDNHRGLGLTGRDDQFWLTRYRAFANYRHNEYFRLYGEYLYADSGGEDFNNRPIEENRGEIQNLFLDTRLTENTSLRLGRQEFLLGAQRFVSPLDWANTRRTFDGGSLSYQGDVWGINGFFTHPVNRNAANESKIDDTNENIDFFGFYATRSDLGIGNVDAYYLGLDNRTLDFDYHTLGTRVWGKAESGLLYEFEGGVQFGTNSPGYGSHSAQYVTAGLGRQLPVTHSWKPTVWMWYDWASGGDDVPAARGDDGLDHLFPLAHKYLGFMDLFGRRNINDLNMQFISQLPGTNKVKLLVWYHYLFLDQKTTPYNVNMSAFNGANAAGDRELGHEIDVLLNIALNPRNSVLLGYSFFNAGDYYDTTAGVPTNADAQFFYMQYQTRF